MKIYVSWRQLGAEILRLVLAALAGGAAAGRW